MYKMENASNLNEFFLSLLARVYGQREEKWNVHNLKVFNVEADGPYLANGLTSTS